MRSYPLNEARAEFSKLVDRALAGEPQRVTRRGREAVVIVSESEWSNRYRGAPNLGALLADFALRGGFREDDFHRPGAGRPRPLGADFEGDE